MASTYRSDGGMKCASCGRGFMPDDLQLDANGEWMCVECTRQHGRDDARVLREKGLRARRRMQLLGAALAVAVLFVIGWRVIAKVVDQRREVQLTQETHDRVKARVDALRSGKAITEDKPCNMDDVRRRAAHDRKISYVESSRLDGGVDWFVASEDVEQLLSFEKNPARTNAQLAASALDRLDKSGVLMLLVPTKSAFGPVQAHWQGHVVLVDPIDLTPLCAQPLAIDDRATEAASTLTHAAKTALASMTSGELELRF